MNNWDPRQEDFNDLNYSTVRGGPASSYVRKFKPNDSNEAFSLHVTNIPLQMTTRDLSSHFSQNDVSVTDVIILPKKDNFNTNHAIVKVENTRQGLQVIEHFNKKPPLHLSVQKALNKQNNSNINARQEGFQPMKPTPVETEVEELRNLRRPNKAFGMGFASENGGIDVFKTKNVEEIKVNLEERFNDMKINYVDCKPVEKPVSIIKAEKTELISSTKKSRNISCIFCGEKGCLRCSICFAFYCSQICQQDDWYYHQEKCKPPPKLVLCSDRVIQSEVNLLTPINIQTNNDSNADIISTPTSSLSQISLNEVQQFLNISEVKHSNCNSVNASTSNDNTEIKMQKIIPPEIQAQKIVSPEIKTQRIIPTEIQKFHFNKLRKYVLEENTTYPIEPIWYSENYFVRINMPQVNDMMKNFLQQTRKFFSNISDQKSQNLIPGELFCVHDEIHKIHCRVKAIGVKESKILSHYVDYGNVEELDISEALIFDKSFLDMSVACFELERRYHTTDRLNSLNEAFDNSSPLSMTVYKTDPLTVCLQNNDGQILLQSTHIQNKTDDQINNDNNNGQKLTNGPASASKRSESTQELIKKVSTPERTGPVHTNGSLSPLQTMNKRSSSAVSNTGIISEKIYKKTYDDVESLSIPIESGVRVCVLYKESVPILNVIPEKNLNFLEELQNISEDIEKYCNNRSSKSYRPEINDIVLAFYNEEKSWYRAAVLEINENDANVIFVDYGNVNRVEYSNICPMLEKFMKIPVLAITCLVVDLTEISEKQKISIQDVLDPTLELDVTSYEDFTYKVSIPSLSQTFKQLLK